MSDPTDSLLRDVARKIQLPSSLYQLAVQRYEAIHNWLERAESPLASVVGTMYAQGSMMIGAAISSKVDDDEFDIDLILELNLPADAKPRWVLDTLETAIRGKPGSRYYDVTERQTRCVTVSYEKMHLDVTPAILLQGQDPRTSCIFHSKRENPEPQDKRILSNPWGFGKWFELRTPLEMTLERAVVGDMAMPVQPQEPVEDKSLALISLQLLKRWRNIHYDGITWRKPPSVLMAKLVADAATGKNRSLHAELLHQVASMYHAIKAAHDRREKITVINPRCALDNFADRWPEDLTRQAVFLNDLGELHRDLRDLDSASIADKQKILIRLFGERTARVVVEDFQKSLASAASGRQMHHVQGKGNIAVGASLAGSAAAAATNATRAKATPSHTFYGSGSGKPDDR